MKLKPLIAGAAIVFAAAACQPVSSSGGSSGGETAGKALQHTKDVKILKCGRSSFGTLEAKVKVTNHSSKASDYVITIAFESKSGHEQIDTGDAVVDSLQPGQSTTQNADSTKDYKHAFRCELSDAQRTQSSL